MKQKDNVCAKCGINLIGHTTAQKLELIYNNDSKDYKRVYGDKYCENCYKELYKKGVW